MYNVIEEDSSEVLGDRLEKEWMKELEKSRTGGKPSLLKAIFRMFGLQYILLGIIVFIEEGTKVGQPLLLGQLIRYFTPNSTMSSTEAYMYAMGVSISSIILAVAHHPYFFEVQRLGMKLRVACCSLLYRKSLRLSNKALGQTTIGQIVNLMSNDVNRFDTAAIFLHYLWVGPAQAIPVLIILWYELGPATLAGFAVLLLLVPVQSWMGKLFSKLRRKTAVHTDERVKIMNEIISGIRVIKMYCWEKPFGELVAKVRRLEGKILRKSRYFYGFTSGLGLCGHQLCMMAIFLSAVLIGQTLLTASIYICVAGLHTLEKTYFIYLLKAFQQSGEVNATLARIQKFLLLDELEQPTGLDASGLRPKADRCHIKVSNITAKWDKESDMSTLEDISVEVKPGKLLAVIGPVGAGKSSFLMSLLGELPIMKGNISIQGKISYISQQPWVFSASLRQNIIFGNKFESDKYNRILKACALNRDIDLMSNGDGTLIGDRGVSLSGGQKARVSLARALYMDADIYILDDPLSAVDTAVGRHLFDKVVQGVLKNKPRILVTHQLHFLKEADEILILKDGKCLGKGTFEEISTSGVDFSALLKRNETEEEEKKAVVKMEHRGKDMSRQISHHSHHSEISRQISHHSDRHDNDIRGIGSQFSLASIGTEFEPEPVQTQEEEERKEGTVGLKVYYEYFKAGAGVFKFIILVLLNLIAQAAYVGSDWWLSYWSNLEEERYAAIELDNQLRSEGFNITNVTIPEVETHKNVYIFSGIIGGVFLFGLLRALMFFKVAVDASMHLHNSMFHKILRTPVRFFDTNPVGRVLNRFSKDTGSMDDMLPITFFDFVQRYLFSNLKKNKASNSTAREQTSKLKFLKVTWSFCYFQCLLLIIGIIAVVAVVIPWVLIPLFPICILFVITRQYYIKTSRHIKRLEGTTRSPVFSHLSASLQGLHTIRAFGVQGKFMAEFDSHQDLHTESWFLFLTTSRWLAVRLDWMCALFVTAVSFCCVLVSDSLNAGLVGLSMTYALTLMGMFQWAVRQSAEVENQMISVERVLEYSNLTSEADLTSNNPPPDDWPQGGAITAYGAKIRYSENMPWVFKGLDFEIHGKEKVGIVGRTGAEGVDMVKGRARKESGEGREEGGKGAGGGRKGEEGREGWKGGGRSREDPVLFTGTLRKNLDPFNEQDDAHLWNSLEEVQLKSAIDDLPGQLDSEVSEGGTNFSVGQRQLICLARAILRRNKILMIDEATANVDPRTDAKIQQTIRDKFSQCTVLTIAHRLNTIMDSDRVMVLDEGKIVEFDHPYSLLQDNDGVFNKMVQQTGKAEFDHLMEIARNTYNKKSADSGKKDGTVHQANGDVTTIKPDNMKDSVIQDSEELDDIVLKVDDIVEPSETISLLDKVTEGKKEGDNKSQKSDSISMLENEDKEKLETSQEYDHIDIGSEESKVLPDSRTTDDRQTKDEEGDDQEDERSHLLDNSKDDK
ncbi:hypothetical protein FSP39_021917 [Pinctada imbricata]|uniref:Cystic fibrosis transmembrane conductance regulator n=1 Tax=Pinctada imbricata TaxID=66713 RepID=A0AA88Y7I9_PINIB|nr:hypothetical protein FSP39_021917 [Pinctada imbricata]